MQEKIKAVKAVIAKLRGEPEAAPVPATGEVGINAPNVEAMVSGMEKPVDMPTSQCPACQNTIDAASGHNGKTPKAGDLSICGYCGAALQFNPDLTLALISDEAWAALEPKDQQDFVELSDRMRATTTAGRHARLLAAVKGSVGAWKEAAAAERAQP